MRFPAVDENLFCFRIEFFHTSSSGGPLAASGAGEHEQKIKDRLRALDIPFVDKHVLRSRGYDKKPDVKLEVPIAVGRRVINLIQGSLLFGDREAHEDTFETSSGATETGWVSHRQTEEKQNKIKNPQNIY